MALKQFTKEELRERKRACDRAYYEKNKEHLRDYQKKYRKENPEKVKEADRLKSKRRWGECPEKERLRQRKWNILNRERHKARNLRSAKKLGETRKIITRKSITQYRENYPNRHQAHRSVEAALRIGRLTPEPCKYCGELKTQAHHDSYVQTEWLNVTWLCRKHHDAWHRVFIADE